MEPSAILRDKNAGCVLFTFSPWWLLGWLVDALVLATTLTVYGQVQPGAVFARLIYSGNVLSGFWARLARVRWSPIVSITC